MKIGELGPDNVLAFLLEPVGGLSTGAVVPPPSYFRAIRDICTRHGVFLVFNEILCGAGRTGQFVTAHHWADALPDIVVQAKGVGAGHAPLGVMWVSAAHADLLAATTGFDFSYSYNANPIACAVGSAVLDEFERLDLCANATARGAPLRAGLERLKSDYAIVGDVRGKGFFSRLNWLRTRSRGPGFHPISGRRGAFASMVSTTASCCLRARPRAAASGNGSWWPRR